MNNRELRKKYLGKKIRIIKSRQHDSLVGLVGTIVDGWKPSKKTSYIELGIVFREDRPYFHTLGRLLAEKKGYYIYSDVTLWKFVDELDQQFNDKEYEDMLV